MVLASGHALLWGNALPPMVFKSLNDSEPVLLFFPFSAFLKRLDLDIPTVVRVGRFPSPLVLFLFSAPLLLPRGSSLVAVRLSRCNGTWSP